MIPPFLPFIGYLRKKGGKLGRIIYIDPEIIANVKNIVPRPPDPAIVEAVNDAMESLDPHLRQIVFERYFEGLSIPEISARNGVEEKEVSRSLYKARRKLRTLLAAFVRDRWKIETKGICRICSHPQKRQIENILRKIDSSESWGEICGRIKAEIGEYFHPPQILKAHLIHMKESDREEK
jgi:hypothetical protein